MKFTSDRQRKAMFWSFKNKFSDSSKRKVVVVAARFKRGGENDFINSMFNDPDLGINDIAIIDNNTKGMSEIYIDTKDDMAQKLAFAMSATPGQIRGFVMDEPFDDIINDPVFLAMGGHKVSKLSDVEIPSDVYSKKSELSPTEKQKLADDKRYLVEQFDLGTISQRQYVNGINSLKQPEEIVIEEEPEYVMTAEDYKDMYPTQKELDRRHKEENERYLKLYEQTKDEIDYDFGDNNVMWTAEMGVTSRNQYLDMLANIMKHNYISEHNLGKNLSNIKLKNTDDVGVGSTLFINKYE